MLLGNTLPDGMGYPIHQVLDSNGRVKTDPDSAIAEAWEHSFQQDTGINSLDFTPAADTKWRVDSVYVSYVSSAVAGNRRVAVQILDADGVTVLFEVRAGNDQAASLTRLYSFAPGIQPGLGGFTDTNFLQINLPSLFILPDTYILRVCDVKNIDDTGDAITVTLGRGIQRGAF